MPPGDLNLLVLGVAREMDDLHPVAERRQDRVEEVRRRDEQDSRQIERDVEVVVPEGRILFWIEHLEEG